MSRLPCLPSGVSIERHTVLATRPLAWPAFASSSIGCTCRAGACAGGTQPIHRTIATSPLALIATILSPRLLVEQVVRAAAALVDLAVPRRERRDAVRARCEPDLLVRDVDDRDERAHDRVAHRRLALVAAAEHGEAVLPAAGVVEVRGERR